MASWNCPKCGNSYINGKFCPKCGAMRPVFRIEEKYCCPKCWAFVGKDVQFCSNCGKKITPKACKVCTGANYDGYEKKLGADGVDGLIRLPKGITHITEGAFENFDYIHIYIPSSVKYVGEKAFLGSKRCNVLFEAKGGMCIEDFYWEWEIVQSDYHKREFDWHFSGITVSAWKKSLSPMIIGDFLSKYGCPLVRKW